jgi:hypothetical protein
LPGDLAALLPRLAPGQQAAIAVPAVDTDDALAAVSSAWLAPAVRALEDGEIGLLQLVADGHGAAVTWRAARPTAWARIAARFDRRPFRIPPPPDA